MKRSFISVIISAILAFFGISFGEAEELQPIGEIPVKTSPPASDLCASGNDLLWYKTHDYFGGFHMGEARLIRSGEELLEFYEAYGKHNELSKFVVGIDFSQTVLAYEMIEISSGSIGCEFRGAYVSEGKVKFDYDLIYPEVGTCDMAMIYLFAKIPADLLDIPAADTAGDIEIIPFPRKVQIGGETIDNLSEKLVYEEKNARSWSGNYLSGSKAVFLSTDIIKRWYDPEMTFEDGICRFKDGNLDVTITKDTIKAENEIFGEVCSRSGINCIVREKDMLVEIGYLMELLSCGYQSAMRLEPTDDFMVKSNIDLLPDSTGSVNVGELNRLEYNFYTAGTLKEKPDGKIVAINMRGHYIYKIADMKYFLEANGKYYTIKWEMTGSYPEDT